MGGEQDTYAAWSSVAALGVSGGLGIALGLVLSLAITRLITSMLVGVHAIDPLSLTVAATLLLFTAAVAAVTPAWRASQVDPMVALRVE